MMYSEPDGLVTATLEQTGTDRNALQGFYHELETRQIKIDSFMLLCREGVAEERYWPSANADLLHPVYSITKSVTATAIGLLEAEGQLTMDAPLLDFFPEYRGRTAPHGEDVLLRHLLTMTCGHDTVPSRIGISDWAEAFWTHPFPHQPGSHFLYNALSTYMLTALIHRITGQNLTEYLEPRVFAPLEIKDLRCDTCPKGIQSGAGGLYLRTRDLAKLALLYLNDGIWHNCRLLPEGWVERSSAVQIGSKGETGFDGAYCARGYGFQMWPCAYRDAYRFDGAGGQYAFIVPSLNKVLITTAAEDHPQRILEAFLRWLLPTT